MLLAKIRSPRAECNNCVLKPTLRSLDRSRWFYWNFEHISRARLANTSLELPRESGKVESSGLRWSQLCSTTISSTIDELARACVDFELSVLCSSWSRTMMDYWNTFCWLALYKVIPAKPRAKGASLSPEVVQGLAPFPCCRINEGRKLWHPCSRT